MLKVLVLFLLPVGGGIPSGVLLARASGLAWPMTAGLYLLSDVLQALALEPILRLLAALAERRPLLKQFKAALKQTMAQSTAYFSGTGMGPFSLVMIAFGLDPISGRVAALAAGHGVLSSWAIAIAGDLLYYAVIALTTLRLSAYIRNPHLTAGIVLAAMFVVPILVLGVREARRRDTCAGPPAR